MKSKLVIIGLMLSSMLAIAASGQITTNIQQVVLQDDKSGDHLVFVVSTGEYKFQSCKGNFTTSGKGSVSVTGCSVVLKDVTDTRRVVAEVDLCAKSGKADVAFVSDSLPVDAAAVDFAISDANTANSSFDCTTEFVGVK
jgi:hypothetical protein